MIIPFSDSKKQQIINCIQSGLENAKTQHLNDGIKYDNGAALHTLNFIFKHLDFVKEDSFELYSFKRGPYMQTLIYDKDFEMLISLTSQNNINRLKKRKNTNKLHYIDSFLLFNKHIPTIEQTSLFADNEDLMSNREKIKKDIETLIFQKTIKYYMIVEYQIHYKTYSLLGVKSQILSPNYYTIETQNWGKIIKPNYDTVLYDDNLNNVAPIEQKDSPYVKQKGLAVGLKIKK